MKQCKARTTKGHRCQLSSSIDGYCILHYQKTHGLPIRKKKPTPTQCKAITKKGTRCTYSPAILGYCIDHYQIATTGKLTRKHRHKKT